MMEEGRQMDVDRPEREIVWKTFTAEAPCLTRVRSWSRRQLRRHGLGPDRIQEVVLLLNELATNAVRHARSAQIVVLLDVDSHVEGAVRDEDPTPPRPRR